MPYQELKKTPESASAVDKALGLEMHDRLQFFFSQPVTAANDRG